MQSRWRSKTAWVSVAALFVFILKTYTNIQIPEIDKLIELVLISATAFGVFNNPTSKDMY